MSKYMNHARDPISSLTHLIGAGLSVAGTIALLVVSLRTVENRALTLTSSLIFGFSMLALYSASAFYHYYKGSEKAIKILRKVDHSMIYVLIAGTYTPILLLGVGGREGIIFTMVIWAIAFSGIAIKLCWINAPRWLYTGVYLLMGWAIVFYYPALLALDPLTLGLVAAGGIAYTIGAVMYIFKKPNFLKSFGF
ncbi:MAG: hemolysin III family protein, partial [Oscillospiraceae bacterium]